MSFYFLKEYQYTLTNYQYKDFDEIVKRFGYSECKNDSLHVYFDWSKLNHYQFPYELYEPEIDSFLMKSSFYRHSNLLIRTNHSHPLIEMTSQMVSKLWKKLCEETSYMGWEAISIDGRYILEFTDDYQHLALSNFKIHPQFEMIKTASSR
jgi:hypothetical protein